MESAQREVVSTLLKHIFSLGLISQATYCKAEDLVYSMADIPELLRHSACWTEEVSGYKYSQDPE